MGRPFELQQIFTHALDDAKAVIEGRGVCKAGAGNSQLRDLPYGSAQQTASEREAVA
jgi:hypothetical protein